MLKCIILSVLLMQPLDALREQKDTYTAAVVEYFPLKDFSLSPTDRINANVGKYIDILKSITEPIDIAVFPESTLQYGSFLGKRDVLITSTTIVPSFKEHASPCADKHGTYDSFFTRLSCAAIESNTYLSVNLLEREKCKHDCKHDDKWNVYNTNVVFDRKGFVVARYRKYNLFGEMELDKTASPEIVTFTTDFGVTFGVFICFDIMFEEPAMKLVKSGVKHFVYPNMWFSELNQLTSLQTHQMWSYGNDVAILSAGANNPRSASGGSGIFQGRHGPLETYISGDEGNKVLIQKVYKTWETDVCPKKSIHSNPNMEKFHFWKENYENYTSIVLDGKVKEYKMCNEDGFVCCNFIINATKRDILSETTKYHYHVAMLSGYRTYYHHNGGTDSCVLMACLDDHLSSCGQKSKDPQASLPFIFNNITISIIAPKSTRTFHYPNSLTGEFIPLSANEFRWNIEDLGKKLMKTTTLRRPHNEIFTFGIFGRNFNNE